ncbi:MAG TPA: sigma-70 family RNA polymerase sigma factor [Acidimicrobiales bacterium]|nr:sigma-70 family RNA polymerase sigma factor [Acidimicrobiales bacterium]
MAPQSVRTWDGDKAVLVESHLPLARQVAATAARRLPRHVVRDDLESAALEGLAAAAAAFDPGRGTPFAQFARLRIHGAVVDELRSMDWAPRSLRRDARRLDAALSSLMGELGRQPTGSELASGMGVGVIDVNRLQRELHQAAVLNYDAAGPNGESDAVLPAHGPGPEATVLNFEIRAYLADAIRQLPERLRLVVVDYFFEERPMQDIARRLGVTESRVSQMRAEALALLRDGLNSQLDPDAVSAEPRPNGRVARRKAAYYSAIAAASDHRRRVCSQPIYVGSCAGE